MSRKVFDRLLQRYVLHTHDIADFTGDASDVTIADAGGYFTASQVEAALQEIGAGTTLDSRYVQVAGDTMTGELILAAGDADDAPIKLQAGTKLGTPEAGAVEFDGASLLFTPASDRRSVNLADGVIVSSTTVANTTDETTIFTEGVSANELFKGSKWRTSVSGHYSTANASDTFTILFKVGGTTIHSFTSIAEDVTDVFWRTEWFFTVRSTGATGSIQSAVDGIFNDTVNNEALTSTNTVDTTTVENLTITIQWDAAETDNTLTVTQGHTSIFGVEQS